MKPKFIAFFILVILIWSCKKKSQDPAPVVEAVKEPISSIEKEVLINYLNTAQAAYLDAYETTDSLNIKIKAFVQNPDAIRFETCKAAWKRARIFYGQTEAYRGLGGPIEEYESFINAWPLDEAYVDYVYDSTKVKNVYGGIINDTVAYKNLDYLTIRNANLALGDAAVSTGYHAIEFLLWGQDFYNEGAGKRSFTDYTFGTNAVRRGKYLAIVSQMLVYDLQAVLTDLNKTYKEDLLNPVTLNYNCFTILNGISQMSKGEFGGERIIPALETKNQEDEHSCFSDNTHIDILMNAIGMQSLYTGTFTKRNGQKIQGRSFAKFVESLAPATNKSAVDQLNKLVLEAKLISAPFDQAVMSDNGGHILNTSKDWLKFGDLMNTSAELVRSAK